MAEKMNESLHGLDNKETQKLANTTSTVAESIRLQFESAEMAKAYFAESM
jgi:hypothetical protein